MAKKEEYTLKVHEIKSFNRALSDDELTQQYELFREKYTEKCCEDYEKEHEN